MNLLFSLHSSKVPTRQEIWAIRCFRMQKLKEIYDAKSNFGNFINHFEKSRALFLIDDLKKWSSYLVETQYGTKSQISVQISWGKSATDIGLHSSPCINLPQDWLWFWNGRWETTISEISLSKLQIKYNRSGIITFYEWNGSITLQQRNYRTATLPLLRNCYILCVWVNLKVVLSFN